MRCSIFCAPKHSLAWMHLSGVDVVSAFSVTRTCCREQGPSIERACARLAALLEPSRARASPRLQYSCLRAVPGERLQTTRFAWQKVSLCVSCSPAAGRLRQVRCVLDNRASPCFAHCGAAVAQGVSQQSWAPPPVQQPGQARGPVPAFCARPAADVANPAACVLRPASGPVRRGAGAQTRRSRNRSELATPCRP